MCGEKLSKLFFINIIHNRINIIIASLNDWYFSFINQTVKNSWNYLKIINNFPLCVALIYVINFHKHKSREKAKKIITKSGMHASDKTWGFLCIYQNIFTLLSNNRIFTSELFHKNNTRNWTYIALKSWTFHCKCISLRDLSLPLSLSLFI